MYYLFTSFVFFNFFLFLCLYAIPLEINSLFCKIVGRKAPLVTFHCDVEHSLKEQKKKKYI